MCFRAAKNQKFGHAFYSVFVRLPFTLFYHGSCDMYVASDAPDPAGACMPCLRLEVCAALLSCWCSLLRARVPATLLSHWHSLSCWASGLPLLWGTCSIYFRSFSPNFSNFSPSWPLSSQLISKTGYLLSFTLVGTPYPVGAWLPSPPGCLLPFSLTDGSSPASLSLSGYLLPFSLVGPLYPISV